MVIGLCTLPGGKQRYVHRLVAEAFIDNPKGLPEVNHIDSDRSNAAASNLEWIDSQQNRFTPLNTEIEQGSTQPVPSGRHKKEALRWGEPQEYCQGFRR